MMDRAVTRNNWHDDYLDLCDFWASKRSKDPNVQVGAVIVRPNKTIISVGFNGFPRHINDSPERYADRDLKLAIVVHAEENALLMASEPLYGCTLYVSPRPPCAHCAALIIQSGIANVYCRPLRVESNWYASHKLAYQILCEAGVNTEFREK